MGLIAITGLGTGLTLTAIADGAHKPPSTEQVAFAERTSDLLLATLFAALTQEFDETTPTNVEGGKQSISLVFNDRNKDMRLVGTFDPLRDAQGADRVGVDPTAEPPAGRFPSRMRIADILRRLEWLRAQGGEVDRDLDAIRDRLRLPGDAR